MTPTASSSSAKLQGYDLYRALGSPRHVVAPMVDASELAWRVFSRSPVDPAELGDQRASEDKVNDGGDVKGKGRAFLPAAHLAYTPMIHARLFSEMEQDNVKARGLFNLVCGEEGSIDNLGDFGVSDRPLIAQFCANDPDELLAAARKIEHMVDAVDLNLGCPQGIAKKGRYGSFLMEEWDLIHALIRKLHDHLSVPVTAKFRVYETVEKTVEYARMLEDAGAQILCCHGRLREMKGQFTGLADWNKIKAVKEAVKVPVFANGNILYTEDIERCIAETGVDGVMSAEGNLFNPALFLPAHLQHQPVTALALRYLRVVLALKTRTASSAVKSHLFKLLAPAIERPENRYMRDLMWTGVKVGREGDAWGTKDKQWVKDWIAMLEEFEQKLQAQAWESLDPTDEGHGVAEADRAGRFPPIPKTFPTDAATGLRTIPFWLSQPHTRPLPAGAASAPFAATSTDEAAAALGVDQAPAAAPSKPFNAQCTAAGSGTKCNNMASAACPHGACLMHCRIEGARKAGMYPVTALPSGAATPMAATAPAIAAADLDGVASTSSARPVASTPVIKAGYGGGHEEYIGFGCEMHEAKVRAREAARLEKNKARSEARAKHQETMRGKGGKSKSRGGKRKKGEVESEEEGLAQKRVERDPTPVSAELSLPPVVQSTKEEATTTAELAVPNEASIP